MSPDKTPTDTYTNTSSPALEWLPNPKERTDSDKPTLTDIKLTEKNAESDETKDMPPTYGESTPDSELESAREAPNLERPLIKQEQIPDE